MKKYILLIIGFLIASLVGYKFNADSPNNLTEVDWTNSSSCNLQKEPDFINALIKKMTLEQKVGQIIMPDIDEVSPDEAKEYSLGTFLNGGGKFPNKNKNSSVDDWKRLSKDFYNASPVVDGTLIPILWGTDAVHGHNNVIGATIFPHNIGLGATRNVELIEKIGVITAKEVAATGLDLTFAPAVSGEPDAMKDGKIKPMSVSRERLVPVLVKAIQELSAKVTALENA